MSVMSSMIVKDCSSTNGLWRLLLSQVRISLCLGWYGMNGVWSIIGALTPFC